MADWRAPCWRARRCSCPLGWPARCSEGELRAPLVAGPPWRKLRGCCSSLRNSSRVPSSRAGREPGRRLWLATGGPAGRQPLGRAQESGRAQSAGPSLKWSHAQNYVRNKRTVAAGNQWGRARAASAHCAQPGPRTRATLAQPSAVLLSREWRRSHKRAARVPSAALFPAARTGPLATGDWRLAQTE